MLFVGNIPKLWGYIKYIEANEWDMHERGKAKRCLKFSGDECDAFMERFEDLLKILLWSLRESDENWVM